MLTELSNKKLNILLVEDDVETVVDIKQIFKNNKITHPLYTAKNGLEALEMLRSQDKKLSVIPQESRLILLAINSPTMNEWEFLSELRSDSQLKVIPVVVLANFCNNDEEKLKLYKLNVAGCISKPVAPLELVEVFMTVIKYWTINELP
ncbi:response regulator [Chroococcus sp. FPU101]|uniref:response regulator n=1 Tax=Chroococcus sp. FPU101 TaxID=1974212 RepID=UPI001A8F6DA8|nr:response regulator [Chroococcus sp. FPU101]GFE72190.1 response regulator [Chroococcus sp. FPU101]